MTDQILSPSQRLTAMLVITTGAFLVSVSVGMNAVIFPTTLKAYGASTSMIGLILSIEIISVLVISTSVPHLVARLGIRGALLLTTLLRVPALLLLAYVTGIPAWIGLVFIHGIGNFLFVLLMQTWLNSVVTDSSRGFSLALYGTALSLGLACGPLVLNNLGLVADQLGAMSRVLTRFMNERLDMLIDPAISAATRDQLLASGLISMLAVLPVIIGGFLIPKVTSTRRTLLRTVIVKTPAAMFAVAMAGVSIFGVQSFIVIYGLENGLDVTRAAYLLSAFMLGAIVLEAPIAWASDRTDRRVVIILAAFLSLTCAVFLPIAIYTYWMALGLLFIWGGIIGGLYSTCLALIGDRFRGPDLIAANAAFSVMDSLGGVIGVLFIGLAMQTFGSDGLPYIIMLASVVYFSYALTRYRVE